MPGRGAVGGDSTRSLLLTCKVHLTTPSSNGSDLVSHLWVAAAVLQLEVLQLQGRSSARYHSAELTWNRGGLPLTQKRKGCFAFKGGTSNSFLLSLIPLNLYFLKQELLPKNFVNNTLLI